MKRRQLAALLALVVCALALSSCTEASRTAAPYPDGGLVSPGHCHHPWKYPQR